MRIRRPSSLALVAVPTVCLVPDPWLDVDLEPAQRPIPLLAAKLQDCLHVELGISLDRVEAAAGLLEHVQTPIQHVQHSFLGGTLDAAAENLHHAA